MQSRTVAWLMAAMLMAPVAQAAAESPEHAITVSGEATLGVAPDLATINAGVTSRAKTAREASDANNKAMQKVLAALHEGGLADRDVRTEYLSLQPLREDVRNAPDRIVGFQASNTVSVRVRDVARLGAVLDRVIASGANEISGISFSVSDQSKRLDEARAAAVADARRKAEVLAMAAGVGLGRAIRIVEDGGHAPVPYMVRAAAAPSAAIATGEQTLRASVSVTFELKH
jgi:uncharacterized protein YggE